MNKKRLHSQPLKCMSVTNYCNLNITGTVNLTRTGLPRCILHGVGFLLVAMQGFCREEWR